MSKGISVAAVVCARGGSKGVPGKNIALVGGKPLIAWSVLAAKQAKGVERVLVSTDSPAIRDAAVAAGAEAPFLRPAELARDDTPGAAPVVHAAHWLAENQQYRPDYFLLLQPTSPLRNAEDVDGAIKLAAERAAEGVVSVTSVSKHPFWMKQIALDGRLEPLIKTERQYFRRQDLPPAYALNGAIYLIRRDILLAKEVVAAPNALAYVMPSERSLDIDSQWDLKLVDLLLKERLNAANV